MDDGWVDRVEALYVEMRDNLYSYALAITRNSADAEDAVHAAVQNLLRKRPPVKKLKPYFFRCVRNAALGSLRKTNMRAESIFVEEEFAEAPRAQWEPGAAFDRLSADEREAIVLKVYEEMTFREIAALRRVSINTAASWYRRGIEKMRDELEKEDE